MIRIRQDAKPSSQEVFSKAVPAYYEAVEISSPNNSSPYRMSKCDLLSAFKEDPWRLRLLENVEVILNELETFGVVVPAVLIGGGFVRRLRDGSRPNDIDSLVFYRVESTASNAIAALAASVSRAKSKHIDMRLCPLDADPLIMMKTAIFYSILFSKMEGAMKIENGLILYERSSFVEP